MSWKMSEKPKTMLASKSLVTEFTEMEAVPYDRPVSERRLHVYRQILARGEFRPVTWASVLCKETNTTYRVNGKHTSLMLSAMHPLPDFYVTVERYICDTMQDAATLYNTFDSKLAARSTNDIYWAFAATVPELKNVPKALINLVVGAAAFKKWGERYTEIPPAERAEELIDCHDFAVWLDGIITGVSSNSGMSSGRSLRRQAVVNAMLATYDKGPNKAKEFWTLVRDESAPERDDPTRKLARYLVEITLTNRAFNKAGTPKSKRADSREVLVKCFHAWNAWRKGETTNLNYYAKAEIPKLEK